jgi:hypothetical protein
MLASTFQYPGMRGCRSSVSGSNDPCTPVQAKSSDDNGSLTREKPADRLTYGGDSLLAEDAGFQIVEDGVAHFGLTCPACVNTSCGMARDATLEIRMTVEEKAIIRAAAVRSNRTISDWARLTLLRAITQKDETS